MPSEIDVIRAISESTSKEREVELINEQMLTEAKYINTRQQLRSLARTLGVRDSWHEPDEQGLTAKVKGKTFDNAGTPGEMVLIVYKDGSPIFAVNIATLLAFATGWAGID